MQGTGTQTDPYQIETWNDFIAETQESPSDSVYYMLAGDLDGNDYNDGIMPFGIKVHRLLNGNGHTIRNIYNESTNGNVFAAPYGLNWSDLTVENVQTSGNLFALPSSTTNHAYFGNFTNCKITAKCRTVFALSAANFMECTISALTGDGIGNSNQRSSFTRCSINIKINTPGQFWSCINLFSTRFEAELMAEPISASAMNVSNSVIAIKNPSGGSRAYVITGDSFSPSVIDATLWGDNPTTSITNCILLPTEDMKNAAKLNAAGFAVVAVS